jgi:hypothetical protein
LAKTISAKKASFVVNTGDNFYWCGITGASDPNIKTKFTEPFHASLNVKWYSVLGNHDYALNPAAQTGSGIHSNWVLPQRYYSKRIQLSASEYASFIFLDSSPCIANYIQKNDPSKWDPSNTGPCAGDKFNPNIVAQSCPKQLTWFQGKLDAAPKEDWVIVVGHHKMIDQGAGGWVSYFCCASGRWNAF